MDFDTHPVVKEIIDGVRGDTIVPEGWPLVSVESLYLGVEPDGSGGQPLLEPTDFIVRPEAVILRWTYTPRGRGQVALSYTYGFTEVPEDVKMAVYLSVEGFYRRRARGNVGISSRGKEGESESYTKAWDTASGLPVEALGMLKPYKFQEFVGGPSAQRNQ